MIAIITGQKKAEHVTRWLMGRTISFSVTPPEQDWRFECELPREHEEAFGVFLQELEARETEE